MLENNTENSRASFRFSLEQVVRVRVGGHRRGRGVIIEWPSLVGLDGLACTAARSWA